jgi:ribosomal protein S18 acetylase RimI-like enzyme
VLRLHVIRPAADDDRAAIWAALEPIIRAGETLALPRDGDRAVGFAYWWPAHASVFVAEVDGRVAGSYFLRTNQLGGGSHVANAGYLTAPGFGGRGIARALCAHSLDEARRRGYRAMQYNFVVSTNARAVHLWQAMGFAIVGRLPGAFAHPTHGDVDAFVMHRWL